MGKIDAVKSKINVLTALMIVFLTTLFAIIGYTFIHRRELDFVDGCIVFGVMVLLIVVFCGSLLWISKEIKNLEKM